MQDETCQVSLIFEHCVDFNRTIPLNATKEFFYMYYIIISEPGRNNAANRQYILFINRR